MIRSVTIGETRKSHASSHLGLFTRAVPRLRREVKELGSKETTVELCASSVSRDNKHISANTRYTFIRTIRLRAQDRSGMKHRIALTGRR